jgi:hypothetical protein
MVRKSHSVFVLGSRFAPLASVQAFPEHSILTTFRLSMNTAKPLHSVSSRERSLSIPAPRRELLTAAKLAYLIRLSISPQTIFQICIENSKHRTGGRRGTMDTVFTFHVWRFNLRYVTIINRDFRLERGANLSQAELSEKIESLKLKRIFKYPAWKYPGQFGENSK